MTDCYFEKKNWRDCKREVRPRENRTRWADETRSHSSSMSDMGQQMEIFRECWKRHGNDKRTESKDV